MKPAFLTLFITLVTGSSIFAQSPPLLNYSYLGFKNTWAGASMRSGFCAALLITSEQNSALQAAWKAPGQELQELNKSQVNNNGERARRINEKLREIVAITDGILTQEQIDARTLLDDISTSIQKSVDMEFRPKIDASLTPEEKSDLLTEQLKVWKEQVLEEVKTSLPPDRLAAVLATQGK